MSQTSAHVSSWSPPDLIHLQSTIGNKAVRDMVAPHKNPIQRTISAKLTTTETSTPIDDVKSLSEIYGITAPDLLAAIKTTLFAGELFPATYQARYEGSATIKNEFRSMINAKIKASKSKTVIDTTTTNTAEVARQLLAIINDGINPTYLNKFPHFLMISELGDDEGQTYTTFIETVSGKLTAYKSKFGEHDYSEKAMLMRNRIDKLTEKATALLGGLKVAVTAEEPNVEAITKLVDEIETFRAEIGQYEHAWDLDLQQASVVVDSKLTTTVALGDDYKPSPEDYVGPAVGDGYNANLACTLYAILTLRPGWLGAEKPEQLHNILRKTENLKVYDEGDVLAKIRYLAKIEPTILAGQNKSVNTLLSERKIADKKNNIIIDAKDASHTFAAKWDGAKFVKIDNETSGGGAFGDYGTKTVQTFWETKD